MSVPVYSIIMVALNPGARLKVTLDSIKSQSMKNYEIIYKDGGSIDGSPSLIKESIREGNRIRLITGEDSGIYDAMNIAMEYAKGQYYIFMNCGDRFHDSTILERIYKRISKRIIKMGELYIFYGNQYNVKEQCVVYSSPFISDFTAYRNVPCHQVCIYSRELFDRRGYLTKYIVRADYEHFLYAIYKAEARLVYIDMVVADYEGGGFSETIINKRISEREHDEIARFYLGNYKVCLYKLLMILSMAKIRDRISRSPKLAKVYNKVKATIYKRLR